MKHFQLIESGIDINPLLGQIEAHPQLWNQNPERKKYDGSPHSQMTDIWVRYNDVDKFGGDLKAMQDEHVPIWYPAYRKLPALKPILMNLMMNVEGEMLGGVLITKIPPGEGLSPHVDTGWHVEYYDKFYLSLKSGEGSHFYCHDGVERECLNPKPGELWLFDNRKVHWVNNESNEDRITVIICIRTQKFGRF